MKKLLFIPFLFFIAGCSPEFGVSEEGIEKCINKSMDRRLNTFASKKIYERCLISIDKNIAKEKKENRKRELEAERIALKKAKDREKDKENYEKLRIEKEKEKEKERLRLLEKYEEVVLKTKKDFVKAGWEELKSSTKNYWFLAINKKEISDATIAMIIYFLPKTEEPVFTPEKYFYSRGKLGYSLQDKKTNFTNDPTRWWIFECNNKRFIQAPTQNKSNEIYFNDWISRHPIVYGSQYNAKTEIIDNEALIKKALRFLDDRKNWSKPKEKTGSQIMFDYACPNKKI
tara:strand:- start:217 stop:1077 length:861 start_codon:yes stop_codon:yes gene_type:complete